ncbi:MAG: DUF4956 domain-containing protein [Myxococcales bacterium]|nr:MAG: DUF4956 domain-containing protein [Myxococcales bacterium]
MGDFAYLFESVTSPTAFAPMEEAIVAMLLSFVLGQVIAWVYEATHTGLSYARTFTQSLVVLTMIVSVVMLVIGNNIVTAFGLLGALAIIRFRNVLKDTRDTVYVFLSLVIGMAVGSGKLVTAVVGTVGTVAVLAYLHQSGFGTRGRYDGYLSLILDPDAHDGMPPRSLLDQFCRTANETSVRHGPAAEGAEYIYQIRLRDRSRAAELVTALRHEPGVTEASLMLRDELTEL